MKNFAVVAIVVLVGILNLSIAAERYMPSAREIMGQIRRISKMSRSRSSTSPMSRHARGLQKLDSLIEKECQKMDEKEVYKKATERIDAAVEEFKAQIDTEKLEHHVKHSKLTKDYNPLVDYLCAKKPAFLRFSVEIAEASTTCLDSSDRQIVSLMLNVTTGAVEYLCENSGEQVKSFLSDGGLECIISFEEHFYYCTSVVLGSLAEKNSTSVEDDCESALTGYETCIRNQFQLCKNPSNVNFLVGLIARFIRPVCDAVKDCTVSSATENTL